ncbi:nucleoside 2-deoxyribosyltransferase [Bifidobacterium choloepi]|uniref:Nucleoside 2-deoxyribosyltransferase n=1 Tax=Bifidobacterium choloepi TaxID=2614131 RepID=A0A6I5MZR0_9BIFI|nr:nucleoside 2-deoxyribosyltransferase [Bifidobacterium choloepi]NEG69335.1 nucleoside 2-deoxyribosyltransferase [Bifidobacterium choloepi]
MNIHDTNFTSSEPIYDFFVAGPFFTHPEMQSMERLEHVLTVRHKRLFMPRFAADLSTVGPTQCFNVDLQGIRNSRALIANVMDTDPGTMFEIGYAYSLGKPVYVYAEGIQPGAKMNLMIAQAATVILTGPADLEALLDSGKFESVEVTQY